MFEVLELRCEISIRLRLNTGIDHRLSFFWQESAVLKIKASVLRGSVATITNLDYSLF